MRIKPKDIKPLREQLLKEQNNICAICLDPLVASEAVLDHCHKTGYIRAVIHRGCNCFIGSMENNRLRNRIDEHRLRNILNHFDYYTKNYKPILHPTHRTPEEKAERTKKRARLKRKKAKKVD